MQSKGKKERCLSGSHHLILRAFSSGHPLVGYSIGHRTAHPCLCPPLASPGIPPRPGPTVEPSTQGKNGLHTPSQSAKEMPSLSPPPPIWREQRGPLPQIPSQPLNHAACASSPHPSTAPLHRLQHCCLSFFPSPRLRSTAPTFALAYVKAPLFPRADHHFPPCEQFEVPA